MRPYSCVIVDDEPLGLEGLRQQIGRFPDFEVVAECTNGRDAVHALSVHDTDLLLLDIHMPHGTGMEVLRSLRSGRAPATIFVTAHSEFALPAFDLEAVDYVLKPVDDDRFARAVERCRRHISERAPLSPAMQPELARMSFLTVKERNRILLLDPSDVFLFESRGNYVKAWTEQKSHLVRTTLKKVAARFGNGNFLRISRSRMVNLRYVKELRPRYNGQYEFVFSNGVVVSSTRGCRSNVRQLLDY